MEEAPSEYSLVYMSPENVRSLSVNNAIRWNLRVMDTLGTNILSILQRLSLLRSVHYQRFYCKLGSLL